MLSRKDESAPVIQKKTELFIVPSAFVTIATSGAKGPAAPAFSIASTGPMQTKIPAKSLATSKIGSHEN